MRNFLLTLLLFYCLPPFAMGGQDANAINDDDGLKVKLNLTSEYIAIFGDIQYLTNSSYINIYEHSLDWILQQKQQGYKINCVLHTGDITQTNAINQWDCFYDATNKLAQHIPFYSAIGDHDYTWDGPLIYDRYSTLFSYYTMFPLSLQHLDAWYESWCMENIVFENYIHGERYDLIFLEFGPRQEVVEWIDEYVKSHPDRKYILINHEYLETGGGRRVNGLKCVARLQNTTYTTPEQLWNKLIRVNNNIVGVLCGHVGSLYALTLERNDYGREVPQIEHNIQGTTYRYDNWLMLWEFPIWGNQAKVMIVNTQTEKCYNDNSSLFSFIYKYSDEDSIDDVKKEVYKDNQVLYSIEGIPFHGKNGGKIIIHNNQKLILK